MANKAGKLYIRNKVGYRKPPKKLADLLEGETFMLFWYEGNAKKAKAVGRFAEKAQTALINKEAALRRAIVTGAEPAPTPVEPENPTLTSRDFSQAVTLYLSEVKRGNPFRGRGEVGVASLGNMPECRSRLLPDKSRWVQGCSRLMNRRSGGF